MAGSDPVKFGVVANMNRPDGNVTGLTAFTSELVPKRLELVHALTPAATSIALLVNPNNPIARCLIDEVQAAVLGRSLQLHVLEASAEQDLDTAFAALADLRTAALVIGTDDFFDSQSGKTRCNGSPPRNTGDLSNARVHGGRLIDELRS